MCVFALSHLRALCLELSRCDMAYFCNESEDIIGLDLFDYEAVDIVCDATRLPFESDSVDFIYSCHMLEHLYVDQAIALLHECKRVLSPKGYMRLVLPDFDYIYPLLKGEARSIFPRKFASASGQAINHLFCDGQHRYAYNAELIEEIAGAAGFSEVRRMPVEAVDPNLAGFDLSEPGGSFCTNLYK